MKQLRRFLLCYLLGMPLAFSNMVLTSLDGQTIPEKQLRDKWVVINYWAGWCQPCIDEITELNHFFQKHKQRIALFSVNYDHLTREELTALNKKFDIRYPSIEDPARTLMLGNIRAVPATFIFDPHGQLQATLYGGQSYGSLVKFFTQKADLVL